MTRAENHPWNQQPGRHCCTIDECQVMVGPTFLMCRTHWEMVPGPMRDAVYRAWSEGSGGGTAAHRAACLAAIRCVYRRLGLPDSDSRAVNR